MAGLVFISIGHFANRNAPIGSPRGPDPRSPLEFDFFRGRYAKLNAAQNGGAFN